MPNERIHVTPDGRKWRQSKSFVTRYSSDHHGNPTLALHYTTLRDGVQSFLNRNKIDPYEAIKTHDAAAKIVGIRLYWDPIGPKLGDRP